MDTSAKGLNVKFPIYKADGTSFEDLVLHKSAFESVVMSLGDKITGDVYYKNNSLVITMQEYIVYEGVHYVLVNPPTIVREGLVKDNSEAKGLTKYSFTFYHPMYMLGNFEFTDVAIPNSGQERYLAQNKTFSWIGYLRDFVDKLNANLANTQWTVRSNVGVVDDKLSEVLSFDNNFVSDALKTAYETWKKPFTIQQLLESDADYNNGKRFAIVFGMPNERVMVDGEEYIFRLGQGVGLKNNSRTPKNNKIVTRISGYGSENNIPWGYPQIVWTGDQDAKFIYGDQAGVYENVTIGGRTYAKLVSYPIYDGIVNGQSVKLIKHPFTRNHLMPSVYRESVDKKVNPYNEHYDCDAKIIDYYDADGTFPNPCDPTAPSYEIHQFEDIKPELGNNTTLAANAEPYTTSTEGGYLTKGEFEDFIDNEETGLIVKSNIEEEKTVLASLIPLPAEPTDSTEENIGGAYTYHYEIKVLDGYFLTVKYESSGVNFSKKVLYANDAPEHAWDDTMDDDGNYAQSYFKMTLPTLAFDLYACASITEEMKINMRSGACIGCTFPIMVDWEDYKKNFYDDKGNFVPYSDRRNYDKYPDSTQGSITVICQKEYETFGTIMPNVYQQPKQGDIIVFLGISLPQSYIEDAEQRLDEASREYMLENNVPLYEYPLKFDEYFLKNNLNILQQIHNNTRIMFQFGGETPMALFVKQINIKWGDSVLPLYDITLTDDIEVVINQIGQVTEDVSALRVQMSEIQKYYAQNLVNNISSKLSRIQDDIALGKITFQQGLESIGSLILHSDIRSNNYIQGMTTQGRGWRIDELGNAEVESIRVRSFMEIMELLVNRLQAQEGDTMFTDNDQIEYVEEIPYGGGVAYILSLKDKWEGYITTQKKGNILRGVVNTLAANLANVSNVTASQSKEHDGSNWYYTSWMTCEATPNENTSGVTLGNNQILVTLWADAQTPSAKNFAPCELMTIARWGSVLNPNESGISSEEKERRRRLQSHFILSNTDGRITRLVGVNTPKLRDDNYGATLGELPAFVKNYANVASRISDGADYLYAQGIVVEDFIKVDRQGNPKIEYVDKGEWATDTIYLFNEYNEDTGQYETHDVWHNGNYWRCRAHQPYNSTYYEPTDANNQYWQKLMTSGNEVQTIYKASNTTPSRPSGDAPSGWTNAPTGVSSSVKNEYVSTRTKSNGTWSDWSTPALYAHYAEDGTSFTITGSALKHYDTWSDMQADTKVVGGTYLCDQRNDFETRPCIVTWNGTSASCGVANQDDVYIVQEDGHIYQAIDLIAQWGDLGQLKGDKGDDGLNTATVYIYRRYATQPTNTPDALTYDFATGALTGTMNGWSAIVPNSDGNPCWVRQAFVQSSQNTVTIPTSAWQGATKLVEDGVRYEILFTNTDLYVDKSYDPASVSHHVRGLVYKWKGETREAVSLSSIVSSTTYIRARITGTNYKTEQGTRDGYGDNEFYDNNFDGDDWDGDGYFKIVYYELFVDGVLVASASLNVNEQGEQGERGKTGKNYYYGGDFVGSDNTKQFSVTDYETPYFTFNNNKWVWVGANGTYTMVQMGTPSSSSANWQIMVTDFKYLISEAIFSAFAKLGSFIVSGDWMISQNGTVNDVASTDYNLFDPLHPNDNTGNNFIPAYAIDGLTGKAYINDANVAGTVYADKGEFQGLMQNSMYSPWHDLADIQDKSYDNNVITIGDETYKIYTDVKNAGRILRFSSYDFINGTFRRANLVLQGNDIDPQTGNPINTEYFYYHGIAIQRLHLNYGEFVELLGIGSSTKFWGWIVLDKRNVLNDKGLPLNVFVKAMVNADGTIYTSSISDSRGLFRVEKVSTGTYRITLPNTLLSNTLTIVGGVNSDDKRHIFFSSVKVTTINDLQYPYFIAETTDMSGNNVDCPFNFYIHDTSTL